MYQLGFWIKGDCTQVRRVVEWPVAFAAYSLCDGRAPVTSEGYLSAFTFDNGFRDHCDTHKSPKGFDGECFAPWLWFDIDADDLTTALAGARRLLTGSLQHLRIDEDDALVFFSGSKGFHVGIPTALWQPEPSGLCNRACRTFAEALATRCGVSIDGGVYDKVRAFRAPNSRHPKSGLYKVALSAGEIMHWSVDAIREKAKTPTPFDIPTPTHRSEVAATEWQAAIATAERNEAAKRYRQLTLTPNTAQLNRVTLEFIRSGADQGDRHRMLFSAAANLAEFGCPSNLAHSLLTPSSLDCGLSPSEARRQIDCGLAAKVGAS